MRSLLKSNGLSAVIIPQSDPHLSEYISAHWQARRMLSGFTGSAGDLVITLDKALLWTDSRYFLQAADQLNGTEIVLMKDGLAQTPSIADWLCDNLRAGESVGIDGMVFSVAARDNLDKALAKSGISLCCDFDVLDQVWTNRPSLPDCPIYVHPVEYSGVAAKDKIASVLQKVHANGAEALFVSALDEIAWTLNIRSNDVTYNPVVTGFMFLADNHAVLLTNPAKVTPEVAEYLSSQGVTVEDYNNVKGFLARVKEQSIQVDPARSAAAIVDILAERAVCATSPILMLKACKNPVQIEGTRRAMVRDGVAMVKALYEIKRRVAEGTTTTELDVAAILLKYRSRGEHFVDESFGTIAGYGAHGAIVHYEADEQSAATLAPQGLLLIDSGAQYLDGTTDITRTIALGTPTAAERRDFTLVMKGHIALGSCIFPEGTTGHQLDALARQFLWHDGLSYLHGTGHGVGHFLNVHEGPQSIRLNYVPTPLTPGMITSNEPGLYREGVHGIRCENLILTVDAFQNEFGNFLKFETLTLCPFDRDLFDLSIMSPAEIDWVNDYHNRVWETLSPYLDSPEKDWLRYSTLPL